MSYLFLPPDRNVLAGRTVTSTAGTPDADHPLSYLTDLRPSHPARWAPGAWGASISVATQAIQLVVLANHKLDATVTVGGGPNGTIAALTAGENGAYKNPFLYLPAAAAGVTALTLGGTNTGPAIIGEAFAGVPLTLEAVQMADAREEFFDGGEEVEGDFRNILPLDQGEEWRRFSGTQVYPTSEMEKIVSWWRAQRANTRPSVLIKNSAVQDARIVLLEKLAIEHNDSKDLYKITLGWVEFPRYAWT